jgi:hypothetical protein
MALIILVSVVNKFCWYNKVCKNKTVSAKNKYSGQLNVKNAKNALWWIRVSYVGVYSNTLHFSFVNAVMGTTYFLGRRCGRDKKKVDKHIGKFFAYFKFQVSTIGCFKKILEY